MKNGVLAILAILPLTVFAANKDLTKALDSWQPKEINKEKSTLTVVMNEKRVTNTIYTSVIQYGICMGLLVNTEASYLDGIKHLEVVNKFKVQGFILDEPLATCKVLNGDNKTKLTIPANTRVF